MAFTLFRSLTINHTLCGASDSANFPVTVTFNDPTMADVAHGGDVQSSVGADILFFSDSALTTQLPSQLVFYDNVNGIGELHALVTNVSHTVDTVFNVGLGNAAPPARTALAWNANNFQLVLHMPNGSVLSAADSSGNGNTGVINGGASATAGQIDGGGAFVVASSQSIGPLAGASLDITGQLTVEAWVNVTAFQTGSFQIILEKGYDGTNEQYSLRLNNSAKAIDFFTFIGSTTHGFGAGTVAITWGAGTWHHVAGVFDGAHWIIYADGIAIGTATDATAPAHSAKSVYVGAADTGVIGRFFGGSLDEVRVSNTGRSVDWILTSYNNQHAPGNIGTPGFLTWGARTPLVSGGGGGLLLLGCGS